MRTGLLALLLTAAVATSRAATLYVDTGDWRTVRLTNRNVRLLTAEMAPRTHGGQFISQEPVTVSSGATGIAWFSNVVYGAYTLEITGTPTTRFSIIVPDTNGVLSAATLRGTTNVPPQTSQYYTAAQVEARIAAIPPSTGVPLRSGTNATVYTQGGTNVVNADVSRAEITNILEQIENIEATTTQVDAALAEKAGTNNPTLNGLTVSGGTGLDFTFPYGTFSIDATGKISGASIRLGTISSNALADGSISTNKLDAIALAWIDSQGDGSTSGGQATNVFNIAVTGESSNSAAAVALWTNSVPVSNTFSVTFRAVSGGPTNATGVAFMTRETLFWRGGADLLWIGSNTVSRIGSTNVDFYCATNGLSNVVLYARAYGVSTNEHVEYKVDGFTQIVTNGWAAAAGGGGATNYLDPSTNAATTGYFVATEFSAQADGYAIGTWTDEKAPGSRWFAQTTEANKPTKQTRDGKTVVRADGVNDALIMTSVNVPSTYLGVTNGTIIARLWVADNATDRYPMFYWVGFGSATLTCWLPYDTENHFDWGAGDATGRVTATSPAGFVGNWHTIAWRRDPSGTQSIRIDGTNVVSATRSAALSPVSAADFRLINAGSSYFAGDIQAVAFFNTALSDSDCDALGNGMAAGL